MLVLFVADDGPQATVLAWTLGCPEASAAQRVSDIAGAVVIISGWIGAGCTIPDTVPTKYISVAVLSGAVHVVDYCCA